MGNFSPTSDTKADIMSRYFLYLTRFDVFGHKSGRGVRILLARSLHSIKTDALPTPSRHFSRQNGEREPMGGLFSAYPAIMTGFSVNFSGKLAILQFSLPKWQEAFGK